MNCEHLKVGDEICARRYLAGNDKDIVCYGLVTKKEDNVLSVKSPDSWFTRYFSIETGREIVEDKFTFIFHLIPIEQGKEMVAKGLAMELELDLLYPRFHCSNQEPIDESTKEEEE